MAPHEEAKYPDTASAASQLGTNAHIAWETWLSRGDPTTLDFCDDEMMDHLALGMQYVRNRCNETSMNVSGIEKRVDVGATLGFEAGTIMGTIDTVMESVSLYEVLDLKYGTGEVDPEENEQLILYLGGLIGPSLLFMPDDFPVRLTIFQPRSTITRHLKFWDTTLGVIKQHLARLAEAARKCYTAPEYVPGEKQCQWCAHRNDCEARQQHNLQIVEQQFLPVGQTLREGNKPADNYLDRMLRLIPEIENVIKDVRKDAYARAQAGQLPGWKLVQGRKQRKWADEDTALSKIQRWRIEGKALGLDVARPRGAISPAQAEKIPGLTDAQKKGLQSMITVTHGKPVLVPEADPRPAQVMDVEQFFNELQGGEAAAEN